MRSTGTNQRGETVLDYARWVMVKKRDKDAPVGPEVVPDLPKSVAPADLGKAVPPIDVARLRQGARRLAAISGAITKRARRSTISTA